jgi:hypothetical protein
MTVCSYIPTHWSRLPFHYIPAQLAAIHLFDTSHSKGDEVILKLRLHFYQHALMVKQ